MSFRFSSLPAPSIPRTVDDLTSFYNQSYHSDESTDTAAADRKLFFFERDATGAIVPLQVYVLHMGVLITCSEGMMIDNVFFVLICCYKCFVFMILLVCWIDRPTLILQYTLFLAYYL